MALTKDEIISALEEMTVLELNELCNTIQEKWDITPMAAAPAAVAAAGDDAAAAEEKTSFDVILTGMAADTKIQIIKAHTVSANDDTCNTGNCHKRTGYEIFGLDNSPLILKQ